MLRNKRTPNFNGSVTVDQKSNTVAVVVPDKTKKYTPVAGFTFPSVATIIRFWRHTYLESTGKLPKYPPYSMKKEAEYLLAKYGFEKIIQVLQFMATPSSKYYQYPYSLKAVRKAVDEFDSQDGTKSYPGFIGPRYNKLKG